MHFVGLRFQPAKVTLDAVPGARPLVLFILPVVRLAFEYQLLMLGRKILEWNVRCDAGLLADLQEIVLRFKSGASLPRLHQPLRNRKRPVRYREVVINSDDSAEPFACGARAHRVVEAEQGRGTLAIFDIAIRAMQPL